MQKRPATLGEFKPKSQKNPKKGLSSSVFLNQKKYQKNRKRPLIVCVFEHEISNFKVDFLPIFPVDHKFSKIKKINLGWFKSVQSFSEIKEPFWFGREVGREVCRSW